MLVGAVALGALAAGAVAAVYSAGALQSADRLRAALIPESTGVAALLTGFVDEETGERGYVITSQRRFLEPYRLGQHQVGLLTSRLHAELAGDRRAEALLATIEKRGAAWLDLTARPEIADVASGHDAAAVAAERTGTGKARFDALRQSVALLSSLISSEEGRAVDGLHDREVATLWLSIGATAVALVLLTASWLLLRKWVIGPIAGLDDEVAIVAGGDLGHAVRPGGLAEMSSLGESVERMRRRLRDDSDELRHLRAALAEGSLVSEQLRSELAPVGAAVGLELAGRVLPADGTLAGDWYDAWPVSGGLLYLALVDVSGHGALSGILALRIKTLLQAALSSERAPGAALQFVASQLGDTGAGFATGIVVGIDTSSGRCSYASAGHPPGVVMHEDGTVSYLEPTGPLLGPYPGHWTTERIEVTPSDSLVLYTDGLTEARRRDGDGDFELAGLLEVLASAASRRVDPEAILEELIYTLHRVCQTPLHDDATVLVAQLRRLPSE